MHHRRQLWFLSNVLAAFLGVMTPQSAVAEDQPFLTLDTTDIEPEHGHELEQDFTWASGKPLQSFNTVMGESEFEYGWSDQLQLVLAADYDWTRTRDHTVPGTSALAETRFDAVRGEAIYKATDVYFDPLGLGFVVSPSLGESVRSLETKILIQKNFLNDRLRAVVNLGGQFGAERSGESWSDASALNLDAGVSYNITWDWSASLEFNAEHDFAGLLLNGRGRPSDTTYFLGPSVQFIAKPWTALLGVQAQLPWARDSTNAPGGLDHGFSANAERFRIMFRVTWETLQL